MKNFTTIILLSAILLLSACTTSKKTTTLLKAPSQEESLLITKIITQSNSSIPDISGTYNLVKGAYIYSNGSLALKNDIQASSLVIEKLDKNNFGYYYVTKVKGLNTEGYFGGFTYKDGKFYQKVIDYPTTNTTLRDNIHLIQEKDFLKLTVNTINAKRVIQWKKEENLKNMHTAISSALKEEKEAYLELFKERLFPREHLSMR